MNIKAHYNVGFCRDGFVSVETVFRLSAYPLYRSSTPRGRLLPAYYPAKRDGRMPTVLEASAARKGRSGPLAPATAVDGPSRFPTTHTLQTSASATTAAATSSLLGVGQSPRCFGGTLLLLPLLKLLKILLTLLLTPSLTTNLYQWRVFYV